MQPREEVMMIMEAKDHEKVPNDARISQRTPRSLAEKFCEDTSAHGLGKILPVKHWARSVFWSLLFIGAVVVLCIQIRALFNKYQSRPLTTLFTVEREASLPFPVVTICNFNAIKNDSLEAMKDDLGLTEMFALVDKLEKPSPENDTEEADFEYDEEDLENPSKKQSRSLGEEEMSVILATEDYRILTLLGHRFEDMVLSCTFRGLSCTNYQSRLWNNFWHYKYGNCFVFNSGRTTSGSEETLLYSNKPGPSHGLSMELNIEQDEYIGALTPEAGIKVSISNQGEMPFPLEKGVSLAPGSATIVKLRKVVVKREDPFENNRCRKNGLPDDESNLYTKMFNSTYSLTACRESCLAYNQLKVCGCAEYRFPSDGGLICSVTDISTIHCLSKVHKMFEENKLNCSELCPPPCRQEDFKMSSSSAVWPSVNYQGIYVDSSEDERDVTFNVHEYLRKNALKFQVFYEDLNVEVITEERSYELENFVSDIGGQLGLWIGFSVLTMAEFLELFISLCHLVVKQWQRVKNPI